MNRPLRKVAVAIGLMFLALLVNANWVQVGEAGSLRNNPHNSRVLAQEYEHQRGPILVAKNPVARSVPTPNDVLKYRRVYPGGAEYAPVTGYYSIVSGATGIERAETRVLAGSDERLFIRRFADLISGKKPAGGAVELTIDPKAQDAAWQGLAGRVGAVVALDPKTGAILALASSPSYDPGLLTGHDRTQITRNHDRLQHAPNNPLLNRATEERYPPGSTFKVIVTAAALASGAYTPASILDAPPAYRLPQTRTDLHNFAGETCGNGGKISLADALRISCNTAYAKLGVALGADKLRAMARAFGFNDSFDVPLSVVPSIYPDQVNQPQTALTAIGQYNVAMTAMQGALVAAGIGNGGVEMKPYLVQAELASDLSVLHQANPQTYRHPLTTDVARTLTGMMQRVVDAGTGTAAQIPGVPVAGKTGTAQNGPGEPEDAWFISFAPANDPQVAVAVVLPRAGATGGQVAAPVARAVMSAVLGR